jgi:hypothetical protein
MTRQLMTRAARRSVATLARVVDGFEGVAARAKDVYDALRRTGYAVVDDAVDADVARALVGEMRALADARAFRENRTVFARSDGARCELVKPGIFELETHAMTAAHATLAPRFSRMTGRGTPMRDALNETLTTRRLDGNPLTRASVKLQINDGRGGCFPLHFDGDQSLDSRVVTMLCYLNEDWRTEDGGELVYYPFPRRRVVVEPTFGRVVFFDARFGLHRVLPSKRERLCFTVWHFTESARPPHAPAPPGDDARSQMRALLHPGLRKHLAKLVLADEWATSIEESHDANSEVCAAALKTHWDEVGLISRVLSKHYPLGLERLAETMARDDGDQDVFADALDWFPED